MNKTQEYLMYKMAGSDELVHSAVYCGKEVSNGLYHWKYIKRYKGRDGKWRYVYANKKTHKSINDDLRKEQQYAESSDEFHKKADRLYNAYDRANKYNVGTEKTRKNTLNESVGYESMSIRDKIKSEEYRHSASKKILDNSIDNVNKELIDVGRSFVNDMTKNMKKLKKILF